MDKEVRKQESAPDETLTIGLMGASLDTGNLGVAALLCGAVASICHSHPRARIFLVDYAQEPATCRVAHASGTANLQLINIRFSKRLFLPNNIARLLFTALCHRLLPLGGWRKRVLERNRVLKAIQGADMIGSIAGGDSFSDVYGMARLFYVALPQILVLLLKKPLVLLPQTLGPFESRAAKAVARYVISRASKVYSRDQNGRLQDTIGAGSRSVDFCYDMGFVMEPRIDSRRIPIWLSGPSARSRVVGLNISGLLHVGGYTGNNMFGLRVEYPRLACNLVQHFVRKHGVEVMLVPHVFRSDIAESDLRACRHVYDETISKVRNHVHLIDGNYDHHEVKALIGRCDFFLGSRMHACIAALSQSVPAVGLAYSQKFCGVFLSLGLEDMVIDLRKLDEPSIIEAVESAYRRRGEIREILSKKMPEVRSSVLSLFRG